MLKKISISLIAIICTFSVVYSMNSEIQATTLPTPMIYVEGKTHSNSSDAQMNDINWETDSPYLDFTNQNTSKYVLFSELNPKVVTMMVTVSIEGLSSTSQFIFGNCETGGMFIDVSATGNYRGNVHVAGAYHELKGSAIELNKEVTIIVTYDGKKLNYYENGKLLSSKAIVGTITPPLNQTVWAIGANPKGNYVPGNLPQFLNGKIKNAAVYDRAFSQTEVKQLQDNVIHLYHPELTFVHDGDGVETLEDVNENMDFTIADKFDVSSIKTTDVTFCIIDEEDNCIGMSSDVLDLVDNGQGGVSTILHKGGSVRIKAMNSEEFVSGIYKAQGILTINVKNLSADFSQLPQNSMTKFEYGKNVSSGTVIGNIAFDNFYNAPVTISLKPSTESDHVSDVQNFELVSTSASTSPVKVKIKDTGAMDMVNGSLKAGTYKFKVEVIDDTSAIVKDASIVVEKATPTLSFQTTTQKDMKIGDALYSDGMSTNNTDIRAISDVSYSLTGGVSGVLSASRDSSDPLKYKIEIASTFSGVGLPATYVLSATLKETENFNAITTSVKRNIFAYKELSSLTWAPNKGSFTTSEVSEVGVSIGTVLASDGVGPFTYEIVGTSDESYDAAKGVDGGSFQVSNTPVVAGSAPIIKNTSALTAKDYYVQFKVSDAKGTVSYTQAVISVTSKGQEALDFKDKAGGNVISSTGLKIKYNDTSAVLLAEGGSTSGVLEYEFAPSAMQPGGVNPSSYASINKISGLITPLRTGTIKVQAKRPGDETFGDIVVYMNLSIEPALQSVSFVDTNSVVNVELHKTKLLEAKGTIQSTGESGIGEIIYESSDESIATVDENGNVKGVALGSITLTATMNDPSKDGYNSNYDTVTCTKNIRINEGMSIAWSAVSENVKAEANQIGDKLGILSVSHNTGAINYEISTVSSIENSDASFFQIVGSGMSAQLQLKSRISAIDQASHGGTFHVQVEVSDSQGTKTMNLNIVIDEADNDLYFTENGSEIIELNKVYGENENSFDLNSASSNSASVTYQVDPSDTSGVLSVSGIGEGSIHKTGDAEVQAIFASGGGYAGGTISMPITITQGNQNIAFQDTTTLNQPFVKHATFLEPAILKETTKEVISSRLIEYKSESPMICTIDDIGTVTMLSKGICKISAVNKDHNWKLASVNKTINLYDGMGVSFTQASGLQAESVNTLLGGKVGELIVSGGSGTKTYALSENTGSHNIDASLFRVNESGIISFRKNIMASDLVGKYDSTLHCYTLHVQMNTMDALQNSVTTDVQVQLKGAALNATFESGGTGIIHEEYGLGKSFMVSLGSNKGGGIPIYRLKDDPSMPSDVLSNVDSTGLITIQHANDKISNATDVKVEALIPPSNGYEGELVEVVVEISKAPQPDFSFKTPKLKLGYGATIEPTFQGNLSSGTIHMSSGNESLAHIDEGIIIAENQDGEVIITAIESGDRDYKSATATASLKINEDLAYNFVIQVPSATYGDVGKKATVIQNDATGSNLQQTWSSSEPSVAEVDEQGNLSIIKAGSTEITCTQTSTGEPSVSSSAIFNIKPKPISIPVKNSSKYVGEEVPMFQAELTSSELVGSDTLTQPIFTCLNAQEPVDRNTKAGIYPIQATYPSDTFPNYKVTFRSGNLTIHQDTSEPSWYMLEGTTSKQEITANQWAKEDVNVVLQEAQGSEVLYDEISLDQRLWNTEKITVEQEGNHNFEVSFQNSESKARSTSQTTSIKIDKSKPEITSITGSPAERNAIEILLETLTRGKYFKPNLEVKIKAEDILHQGVNENSGVKQIDYEVHLVKADKTLGDVITSGTIHSDESFTLKDEGKYLVCAIAKDNAGNISNEKCSGIHIRKIGDDSDSDGLPDLNIDVDGDSIPDLNITKNPEDKMPWTNIDSDGDGIADMNIDAEPKDGIPDLNTGIISEWKCDLEVDFDKDGEADYKTSSTLKGLNNIDTDKDNYPDVNIDSDLDGLPSVNINTDGTLLKPQINIDGDGDGIADINLDTKVAGKDQDGIADVNVMVIGAWTPNLNVEKNGKIIFDTMGIKYNGKEKLEDNGVVVKPSDPNISFLPNYALKVDDVTDQVSKNVKDEILKEANSSKGEVKVVYDVKMLEDNKVIQPDGSVEISIPVNEAIKNPKVLMKSKDGKWETVEGVYKDGIFTFSTNYIGEVSVVGDQEDDPLFDPISQPTHNLNPTVQGNYINNGGIGGAGTGDTTQMVWYSLTMVAMSSFLYCLYKKIRN